MTPTPNSLSFLSFILILMTSLQKIAFSPYASVPKLIPDTCFCLNRAIPMHLKSNSLSTASGVYLLNWQMHFIETKAEELKKNRLEKKNLNSPEFNIRACFKVAVYAEFRRDWVEALRFYEDAYHTLLEMIGTSAQLPAVQCLVEIKTVAELLHFKISTLLLHGGKVIEAVTWFHKHISLFRKIVESPDAVFLHWDWMSRQFLVFAELLETSSASTQKFSPLPLDIADRSLTEWEFRPAYYYQNTGK